MSFLKKIFGSSAKTRATGWTTCTVEEMGRNTNAIDALYEKKQDGYLIKSFLSPAETLQLRQSLEKWTDDSRIDLSFGRTYGKTLMGSDPDLQYYFGMAEKFRRQLREFADVPFEKRMLDFFGQIAGGRAVRIPVGPNGENYTPANIRVLDPGQGGLHAHIGNEFIHQYPELFPLAEQAVLDDQLSYFVVLQKPEEGGGLKMFDLSWDDTPDRLVNGDLLYYSEERNRELDPWYRHTLEPEEGDMILFSGGRIWHQVADIAGAHPRITIGGFGARSHDDKQFYFWS